MDRVYLKEDVPAAIWRVLSLTHNQGNAKQNHGVVSPHTWQDGCYQKDKSWSLLMEEVETLELLDTAGGNISWCSYYGKQYVGSSQKLKIGTSQVVQWLRLHASNAGGAGSIPGQRSKIPRSVGHNQKVKNRTAMWSSRPTSECLSKRIKIRTSKRYLHSHVDCSISHSSQDVEAA